MVHKLFTEYQQVNKKTGIKKLNKENTTANYKGTK